MRVVYLSRVCRPHDSGGVVGGKERNERQHRTEEKLRGNSLHTHIYTYTYTLVPMHTLMHESSHIYILIYTHSLIFFFSHKKFSKSPPTLSFSLMFGCRTDVNSPVKKTPTKATIRLERSHVNIQTLAHPQLRITHSFPISSLLTHASPSTFSFFLSHHLLFPSLSSYLTVDDTGTEVMTGINSKTAMSTERHTTTRRVREIERPYLML